MWKSIFLCILFSAFSPLDLAGMFRILSSAMEGVSGFFHFHLSGSLALVSIVVLIISGNSCRSVL